MEKIKKRLLRPVCAVLLCLTLSTGSAYTSYAAMPGVFLGAEEALAAVLMMLGISAASDGAYSSADALAEWGGEQVDGLVEHISTSQKYSETLGKLGADALKAKVTEWATKAGRGVIDTASDIWGALKDWTGSLHKNVSSSISGGAWGRAVLLPVSGATYGIVTAYSDPTHIFFVSSQSVYLAISYTSSDILVYAFSFESFSVDMNYFYESSPTHVMNNTTFSSQPNTYRVNGQDFYFASLGMSTDVSYSFGLDNFVYHGSSQPQYVISAIIDGSSPVYPAKNYSSVGGVGDIYERDGSLDNVGLTGVGVGTKAGNVPIDWAGFGDVAGTLEGIRTGVLDIADVMAGSKVWAYDTTRDTVIDSDKDLDNDIPIANVVPGANVSDYTITGLQDVFPFCIPFDLIDFLNVLDAEPEAPRFEWEFEYAKGKVYKFDLDLSRFETVAAAFRTFELLGFCLALILITRDKMIKG